VFVYSSGKVVFTYNLKTPINKIISFSEASLLAFAHEDGKITMFDSN